MALPSLTSSKTLSLQQPQLQCQVITSGYQKKSIIMNGPILIQNNLAQYQAIYIKATSIPNKQQTTLALHLLQKLQNNPNFPGHATLQMHSKDKRCPYIYTQYLRNLLENTKTTDSTSKTTSKHNFIIIYRMELITSISNLPSIAKSRQISSFIDICDNIHSLIEAIMLKYSLENRISFWLTLFTHQVKKIIQKIEEQQSFTKPCPIHDLFQNKSDPFKSSHSLF